MAVKRIVAKPDWAKIKHFFPNLLSTIRVISTFEVAAHILAESSLSFLGWRVQPPNPTWGGMIKESKEYLFTAAGLIAFPGLAISLTVLGINQLGDGLRDLLDPHLRGR
jgi:peptide/nickel transport system permease protein